MKITPASLGVGVGGAVILHGADEFVTDIKALWTGHRDMSMTARGLSHIPGVSPAQAELIDAEISILDTWGTVGAEWAASRIGKNVPTLTKAGQTLFSEVGSKAVADHPGSVATKTKAAISNSLASLFGKHSVGKTRVFKTGEDLIHFEKHGQQLAKTLNLGSGYDVSQYVADANRVIRGGTYVPELNGYVKIPTGSGSAKAPFVGIDRATGEITTFHLKPVKFFEQRAPSLG